MCMKVTKTLLRRKGACDDQLDKFVELFPEGVVVTEALCVEHASVFSWDWAASHLLSPPARDEYERVIAAVRVAAQAEYERVRAAAWDEYVRVRVAARDEYVRVRVTVAAAWDEYERVRVTVAAAWDEYVRVRAAAWDEYVRVRAAATFGRLAEKE